MASPATKSGEFFHSFGSHSIVKAMELQNRNVDVVAEREQNSVKVFDQDWVTGSMIAPLSKLSPKHRQSVLTQSAFFKFKSTKLGGNVAVNMPPGITPLADPFAGRGMALSLNGASDETSLSKNDPFGSGTGYAPLLEHRGLGRWYSENIDDFTQTVIMQFGVAEFNSIFSFLTNSSSFIDTYIARHGEVPTAMIKAIKISGIVRTIAMPMLSLSIWAVKLGVTLLTGNKPFSYYYLKPAMPLYWSMVNDIANLFAVKLGITSYNLSDEDNQKLAEQDSVKKGLTTGKAFRLSQAKANIINKLYGWDGTSALKGDGSGKNFIDVYDIVTKRTYYFNSARRKILEYYAVVDNPADIEKNRKKMINGGEFTGVVENDRKEIYNYMSTMFGPEFSDKIFPNAFVPSEEELKKGDLYAQNRESLGEIQGKDVPDRDKTLVGPKEQERMKKIAEEAKAAKEGDYSNKAGTTGTGDYKLLSTPGMAPEGEGANEAWYSKAWSWVTAYADSVWGDFIRGFETSARGAGSCAIFSVNPQGSMSDSASNSTSSISTGGTIKSFSKAGYDANFNTAGGKTGVDAIDGMLDKIKQVGLGTLEGASAGLANVVNTLFFGGGYSDIPDKWEDSSFSGNNVTYTMDLVSPYGNEFSRFQNLYVPLAMILAGALPRGVGKSAYTSPFLCSCYSKATQCTTLGIITDVSVTTGITNQPLVNGLKTNSLRISFTVKDLSNIVAPRMNTSSIFGSYTPVFEDDTPLSKWVNRLTSVEYEDLAFVMPRLKTNLNIFGRSFANVFDASRVGHTIGNAFFGVDPVFFKNPTFTGFMAN